MKSKNFNIEAINKNKFNIGVALLIPLSIILPIFLLLFKSNWMIYIISAILLGLLLFNILERHLSYTLKIRLSKQVFEAYRNGKLIFECKLKDVTQFEAKYINKNYPSFKLHLKNKSNFIFNCVNKGDGEYFTLIKCLEKLMDSTE